MSYSNQINLPFFYVESINHTIIPDSQSELIRTGHSIMLKSRQTQTDQINLPLDVRLNVWRQPKKITVKFA